MLSTTSPTHSFYFRFKTQDKITRNTFLILTEEIKRDIIYRHINLPPSAGQVLYPNRLMAHFDSTFWKLSSCSIQRSGESLPLRPQLCNRYKNSILITSDLNAELFHSVPPLRHSSWTHDRNFPSHANHIWNALHISTHSAPDIIQLHNRTFIFT
jgi:hypothetical protein